MFLLSRGFQLAASFDNNWYITEKMVTRMYVSWSQVTEWVHGLSSILYVVHHLNSACIGYFDVHIDLMPDSCYWSLLCKCWLGSSVVERRPLTSELSLVCTGPAADAWVTIYMGKPSAVGQPTRSNLPFILTGSINE